MQNETRYENLKDDPTALIALLEERDREINRLQVHIVNNNRKIFVKKNERYIPAEQEALFTFEQQPSPAEAEKTVDVPSHKRTIKRGRKPLPDTLPRRREEYYPEQKSCTQCGADLIKIGEEITEELNYVPAHFEVIEHAKIKCACPHCESEGITIGVLPPATLPLPGARPGVGLLVFILVSKYVDHTPLHRLEQIFLRQGIHIARQRMCDWLAGVTHYLELLWRLLKSEALSSDYVQADETYIKVREIETPGQLLQGYFWGVHAPPNIAFFEYFGTRSGEAAKEVLAGLRGRVQTDAYAGYNPVLLLNEVERIACMAHIRRKFREHREYAPAECDRIINQIRSIYAHETQWKALPAEERYAKRQEVARPQLEQLFNYFDELKNRFLPRHNLQDPLTYASKQRVEMFRYLDDGRYHIDNNAIEREIRPIALGRKNYLFAGSHEGARRAAVFYSLLATCKLNKVNPNTWLTTVLKTMPTLPRNRYQELLPHRWRPPAA